MTSLNIDQSNMYLKLLSQALSITFVLYMNSKTSLNDINAYLQHSDGIFIQYYSTFLFIIKLDS